jgi:ABC-2 type transport system ATP-binding protein
VVHPAVVPRQPVSREPDGMTTAIEVEGLRKSYHDTQAVDGLDLTVDEGEVLALLGPNGAGKTSTVEILEGHRTRDQGRVSVLGLDPQHISERAGRAWRARIGIVSQDATAGGELTVAETVRHMALCYPNRRDAASVIEQVGLAEHRDKLVRNLSGGLRRRLDVAVGIVGRPSLLFLDEPTTGFDPQARRDFWELIAGLARDGTTILLTTHYLEEAEALADRVAVINAGRVVALGTPQTLGGRDRAPATVRWSEHGVPQQRDTDDPTRTVLELHTRLGGPVPELTVTRPTLEDTYLSLIGDPR